MGSQKIMGSDYGSNISVAVVSNGHRNSGCILKIKQFHGSAVDFQQEWSDIIV
jgi:hypothetical protein